MSDWLKALAVTALPALALSGCVDDNYDLSDIDTTTRIDVNDLVVPVNIDEITLSDIFNLDEGSKIKVVNLNGKEFYALSETGTFNSDPIEVEKITAGAPTLASTTKNLVQVLQEEARRRAASSVNGVNTYRIEEMGNSFTYKAAHVDDAIVDINSVGVDPMAFHIRLTAKNTESCAESILFTDLVITVPKGMTATPSEGVYDATKGTWTIASHRVNGNKSDVYLKASAIDMKANGVSIAADRSLSFSGNFRVKSGLLTINAKRDAQGIPMTLPETLEFQADYSLDNLVVNNFSGVIDYKLEGMDIDPVEVSDIPEFLADPETNLLLQNPQLYLQLNNPVAGSNLAYQAGISLQAIREEAPTQTFNPASDIRVGYNHGVAGPYNIVMAPRSDELSTPDLFKANLDFISFPTLGNLLGSPQEATVKGLPSQIGISIVSPQIPRQTVTGFALGQQLPGIDGKYELLAPLALADGSVIIYTDTKDGWSSEDLDAVTITKLSASVDVTNSIPLSATLVAYPLDKEGNRIPGVEVKAQEVPANCTDFPVTIEMTGEIRMLDGVTFQALVHGDRESLAPSQTIVLKNIRARVSGWYEKEL